MTLKYLIQKEFLQIRRNAFLPKLIIMFPIVIMCVMPWVMQMEVKNIVVDVVDIDHLWSLSDWYSRLLPPTTLSSVDRRLPMLKR